MYVLYLLYDLKKKQILNFSEVVNTLKIDLNPIIPEIKTLFLCIYYLNLISFY